MVVLLSLVFYSTTTPISRCTTTGTVWLRFGWVYVDIWVTVWVVVGFTPLFIHFVKRLSLVVIRMLGLDVESLALNAGLSHLQCLVSLHCLGPRTNVVIIVCVALRVVIMSLYFQTRCYFAIYIINNCLFKEKET